MRYELVALAYRDLERATARFQLTDRLAALFRQTSRDALPAVAHLCQGRIAPEFSELKLGLAERLAARAVTQVAGTTAERVLAMLKQRGDLGAIAEQLLTASDRRTATLEVPAVVEGLRQIAGVAGAGAQTRKLALLAGLLDQATPLEARYLVRTVTGTLRLGVGTATILDALAQVYADGRASRPSLERAYNVCSDLGLVAATLADGGPAAVQRLKVRPGNPVRPMLAQRLPTAEAVMDKLGGACAAEYKYDGVRVQAHRTGDGPRAASSSSPAVSSASATSSRTS